MYFKGGFTLQGLQNNITVGILFVDAWFRGKRARRLNSCKVRSLYLPSEKTDLLVSFFYAAKKSQDLLTCSTRRFLVQ